MPDRPTTPRRLADTIGALVRSLLALVVLAVLLVGLPWGLVRFVGWPLPHTVPSWSDVETVLLSPMSTLFLLHLLACVLWPVWALFAWDVARSVADLIHGGPWVRRPNLGPVHALAAALVATAVVSLLSRPGTTPVAAAGHRTVDAVPMRPAVTATMALPESMTTLDVAQRPVVPGTVEVRPPEGGVYDSMWRIAQRSLGHGDRWPEIYRLNRGVTQTDGRALTNPNLIRPGWVFRLPGHEHEVPSPHQPNARPSRTTMPTQRSSPAPAPRTQTPPPSTSTTTSTARPAPSRAMPPEQPSGSPHAHGVELPSGGYVGIGLAALISAALLTVRLRRRRTYRPGSRDRGDLTIAPVVRALRIAHDTTLNNQATDANTTKSHGLPPPVSVPAAVPPLPAPYGTVVGERDGRELAWDLAATHGLGLVGPGSLDAARALLTGQLAKHLDPTLVPVNVLMPESDAQLLLGEDFTARPPWLRLVDTLNDALDLLEHELLDRAARMAPATTEPDQHAVLIATPAEWAGRRTQAVLENGADFGLAAVLLGQWRAGTTAHVRPDGTVSATSPESELTGARLFTLPEADTRALLELLTEAAGPAVERAQPKAPQEFGPSTNSMTQVEDLQQPMDERMPPAEAPPRGAQMSITVRSTTRPRPPDTPGTTAEDRHRLYGALKTRPVPPDTVDMAPTEQVRAMTLSVLGRIRLVHHPDGTNDEVDVTSALAPKHREILTFLALHRNGARRDALTAALWPDARRDRPHNSFHATISQMRKAIRTATADSTTDLPQQKDGIYSLDPEQIRVDLWDLEDALRAGRTDDAALKHVLGTYGGDLAPEVSAEWLDVPREALRREVLDAITSCARLLRHEVPDRALVLLEHARTLDRYNEAVYCDIAQIQAELGQSDSVARTYALLTSTLTELDDEPAPETAALFESLEGPLRGWRVTGPQQSA